jgi:pimeloyl-ACP methyl ester carboxylesterase
MVRSFPPGFRNQDIGTDGATIHVDFSGQGPAVVMLHGFADTGDMWAALATELVTDHTVIVPDLRGMGSRFTRQVVTTRRRRPMRSRASWTASTCRRPILSPHDIGNMVGYAFAAQYPERVTKWVAMDAPLPGIGPGDEIVRSPLLWHFNFGGSRRRASGRGPRAHLSRPLLERVVGQCASIDEATRQHYAKLYARPGAMHSTFEQSAAFHQDAIDNKVYAAKGKLNMPVLAIGDPSARPWRTTCASLPRTSLGRLFQIPDIG